MTRIWRFPVYLTLIIWSVFPLYWASVCSFRQGSELFSTSLWSPPNLKNYQLLLETQPFARYFVNSTVVSVASVTMALLLGLAAAYAFGRMNFFGRRTLYILLLGCSAFPQIAVLSGLYELVRYLGFFNTWLGLTLANMTFMIPFTVCFMTTFIQRIPKSLEEAATIEGAGHLAILINILLPMLLPSLITVAVLGFISAWNEFLFALTFTASERAVTLPVAIGRISGLGAHEVPWGELMAGSLVVTAPVVVVVLIFMRQMGPVLISGSVKE